MSIEVEVDDLQVVAVEAPTDIDVTVTGDSHIEVEVQGEDEAVVEVVDAGGPEVEVDATPTPEIEVLEQDTQPVVDHAVELVQGPRGIQGEPGVGVPSGGTARQILMKATSADYEFAWADPIEGSIELDHYTHIQGVPADVWVIEHPLTFRPSIAVVDSAGSEVEGDVFYAPDGHIEVTFSSGFSGTAYLS